MCDMCRCSLNMNVVVADANAIVTHVFFCRSNSNRIDMRYFPSLSLSLFLILLFPRITVIQFVSISMTMLSIVCVFCVCDAISTIRTTGKSNDVVTELRIKVRERKNTNYFIDAAKCTRNQL